MRAEAIRERADQAEPLEEAPIVVNDRPLRDVTEESLRALEEANNPPCIFVRAGALVRTRLDEHGRPIIESLGEAHVAGALTRCADFAKVERRKNGAVWKHVSPPKDVVRDILALVSWGVPPLEAIAEVPILRADGSILSEPGYDAGTRLIYAPARGLRIPEIPGGPTPEDARNALAIVEDAIADFPFVDGASYANTLALLLTPIVRPALRGLVPLALIDKPQAGTGASLLAELVSLLHSGRNAAMMGAPRRDEEMAKLITATLVSGATTITLDNINGTLRSPHLARALTSREWKDRILGASATVEIPQRATWVATGNNVRLGGDLPRRCYWIRLNAKAARPWMRREFRHPNLLEYATENRGELVAALLTIARAWIVAGRPQGDSPVLGTFEEWSETLGGMLPFVGVFDFLGNLEELYDQADDDSSEWEAFVRAWGSIFGERAVTVAELAEKIDGDEDLREVLPSELADARENAKKAGAFRQRLGKALSRRVEVRFGDDGIHLVRTAPDTHRKVVCWAVRGLRGLAG